MAEQQRSVIGLDGCDVKLVDPERVHAVRETIPGPETVESLAVVFGLLSDPSRVRLLAVLLEAGELCVCDLAAACGSSESSVSHALRLLRANRVVRVRREANRVRALRLGRQPFRTRHLPEGRHNLAGKALSRVRSRIRTCRQIRRSIGARHRWAMRIHRRHCRSDRHWSRRNSNRSRYAT